MRFKTSEFKAIQSAITAANFQASDFMNVKKRGRLHVQYKSGEPFIFFRRTAMKLDAEKKFERVSSYEVGPKKALLAEGVDWAEVLELFEKWLAGLK